MEAAMAAARFLAATAATSTTIARVRRLAQICGARARALVSVIAAAAEFRNRTLQPYGCGQRARRTVFFLLFSDSKARSLLTAKTAK